MRENAVRAAGICASSSGKFAVVGTYDEQSYYMDIESRSSFPIAMAFAKDSISWSDDGTKFVCLNAIDNTGIGVVSVFMTPALQIIGTTSDRHLTTSVAWISDDLFVVGTKKYADMIGDDEHQMLPVYRIVIDRTTSGWGLQIENPLIADIPCTRVERIRANEQSVLITNSNPPQGWVASDKGPGEVSWTSIVEFPVDWSFGSFAGSRHAPRGVVCWQRKSEEEAVRNAKDPAPLALDTDISYAVSGFEICRIPNTDRTEVKTLWERDLVSAVERVGSNSEPSRMAVTDSGELAILALKDQTLVLDMKTGSTCGHLMGNFVAVDVMEGRDGALLLQNDGVVSVMRWK